jgi:hypothetical protein
MLLVQVSHVFKPACNNKYQNLNFILHFYAVKYQICEMSTYFTYYFYTNHNYNIHIMRHNDIQSVSE